MEYGDMLVLRGSTFRDRNTDNDDGERGQIDHFNNGNRDKENYLKKIKAEVGDKNVRLQQLAFPSFHQQFNKRGKFRPSQKVKFPTNPRGKKTVGKNTSFSLVQEVVQTGNRRQASNIHPWQRVRKRKELMQKSEEFHHSIFKEPIFHPLYPRAVISIL